MLGLCPAVHHTSAGGHGHLGTKLCFHRHTCLVGLMPSSYSEANSDSLYIEVCSVCVCVHVSV